MPEARFKGWLGIHTRSDKGQRPLGALDNVENLLFNKVAGQGALRSGYSSVLSGSIADISGDTTITSYRYARGTHPATESPAAKDITLLCGTDGSANKHYFVRPFWKANAGTIDESNWVRLGEKITVTLEGKIDWPDNGVGFSGSPIPSNDYVNGWICYNNNRSEALFITDSTTFGLTFLEDVPSDWDDGDQCQLFRYFHDDKNFSPSWTDPVAVKVGNNFIVSGGQGSTWGYRPVMFLPIINKTFFSGASRTPSYNQSYASELELKNDGNGVAPQTPSAFSSSSDPIDASATNRIFMYFVPQTDDGLRGLPIGAGTPYASVTNAQGVQSAVRINFPRLDKRIRYLHVFVGLDSTQGRTSLEYEELFFIETLDLVGTGWTYQNSGAAPGYFDRTVQVNGTKWSNRGEDLATFLGHTEPNRTMVAYSYAQVIAGRLIVGKYYDANAALNYNDQINFTPFAGGVPQWNKLCDIDELVQTTIAAGDPSEVEGLAEFDGKLFIPKTRGIYAIDITYDSNLWLLSTITKEIGCDAPDSLVVTPYGVIWAKSGDGIYLWRGGEPIELTANWRPTFIALTTTYASQWWGWYDPLTKGYRMMYTADGSTLTTVYEGHLDFWIPGPNGPVPVWTKHVLSHNVGQATVRSDGRVLFSTGAAATYEFDPEDTDDAGTQIRPYFKLGSYSVTEEELAQFQRWALSVTQTGTPEVGRQLDLVVYVDGAALKTYSNVTATNSLFRVDLPVLGTSDRNRVGRTFDFEFNANASRRGMGTDYRVHEFVMFYEPMRISGSGRKSL